MRVLVFSNEIGGPTTNFIHNQVLDISEKAEVLYVCNKYTPNPILDNRINIKVLPYVDRPLIEFLRKRLELHDIYFSFKNSTFAAQFKQVVEDFKPDIIHSQFGYDAIKITDNYQNKHIPIVISFRGFDASLKLILKCYVKKLKHVLNQVNVHTTFVCNHLRNNLPQKNIYLRNPHLILYSNTDLEFFKRNPEEVKNSIFTFLQVSSFREKKGQIYTIQAFHQFLRENPDASAQLIFTGKDGNYFEECKHLVGKLDIDKYVQFVGWVDRSGARKLLGQAHVGILHSVTDRFNDQEGIPNALMEAMAMELPVLSTLHAGIPELVEHGKNGYLTEEKDIKQFSFYMNELYRNWKYLPENRNKIIKQFERSTHANTLFAFYQSCLNK